jgi:hypothetical protein
MSRIGFVALGVIATALAGSLVLEVAFEDTGSESVAAPGQLAAMMPSDRSHGFPADHTEEWVATALSRPLFSPDRRPSRQAVVAVAAPAFADLPRLSGILITPSGRSAIFAPSGGGKPVVVTEGTTLGTYVVRSIEPEQVTLMGPKDSRVLRPAFDHPIASPEPLPVLLPSRSANPGTAGQSALENPK